VCVTLCADRRPAAERTVTAGGLEALVFEGHVVSVRLLAHYDDAAVLALHEGLTDRDQYLRFCTAHPTTPADLAHSIAAATSVGAFAAGRLIGVAGYHPLRDPAVAEVALVIDRTVRAQGVGTALLEHLVSVARHRGVRRFIAGMPAENVKTVRMFVDLRLTYLISREGPQRAVELLLTDSG
jgi:GNAT superfamily N-acetyltransferase